MKQAVAVILALFYFTSTVGATVHVHFCMGELVAISLTDSNDTGCGKCGMKKHDSNNNCCKDIKVAKKSSDIHQAHQVLHLLNAPFKDIVPPTYYYQGRLYQAEGTISTAFEDYSPPDPTFAPLYIKYKNFRI